MKRRAALFFLVALLALVGASVAVLRTAWAGRNLCAELGARVTAAAGLPFHAESCSIDPLRLAVEVRGVRLGPEAAPLFSADGARVRFAPIQALGGVVELADVRVERPRLTLAVPPSDPSRPAAACPPPALSQVRLRRLEVSEGSVDLGLPGGDRLRVARFRVRVAEGAARGLRALASRAPRTGLVVDVEGAEAILGGRTLRVEAARADVDLALDLSFVEIAEAFVQGGGARLEVSGTVENLCKPSLALRAVVRAPTRTLLDAAGHPDTPAEGTVGADLRLTGPVAAPLVEGDLQLERVRLGVYVPGDARARFRLAGSELLLSRVEVAAAGGNLVAQGRLRLGREIALEAEARLDGTELGDVLGRLGLPGAWVSMKVRGDLKATGTVSPLLLHGNAQLELADFRVKNHAWDEIRPGERPILELRRGRLETRVVVTPESVRLEDAKVKAGSEELTAQADLRLVAAQGFAIDLAGSADLGELGHVSSVPLAGRAVLVGHLRAAPYGNPQVEAVVRVRDLHLLALDLGEAGADVSYGAGGSHLLRARSIQGRRGETRYSGEIDVDLGTSPVRLGAGRFEASGRLRDLFEGALDWLPAAATARDALEAPVQAEARMSGPADALEVGFTARLGAGQLLQRDFDGGVVEGRIEAGKRALLDHVELRRGEGMAQATGWVGLGSPFPWELDTSAAGVPLSGLKLPGGRWDGTVSGSARVEGSYEVPAVRFAGNGDGVGVLGLALGTVQVGGALRDRVLALTASTEGLKLSGQARLDGARPFEARADVDVEDLARFFPGGPPGGLRARARGEARVRGTLDRPGLAEAEITLSELQGGVGDLRVQNRDPVRVVTSGGRVEVRALTLVGTNTELSLTGAQEADGKLSLLAEGAADLRLLGGMVPGVVRPHGRLQLEAHVSGTSAEPLMVGSGKLREAGFSMRDLPVNVSGLSGDLAFSQNRILFDHLPATVNGGRAELNGEVELSRFLPVKVRASARLDDVSLRIPSSLPSRVSGQLQVAGSLESMLLTGKLDVIWASYTQRVDVDKLDLRRRASAPRTFDKSGEWLRFDVSMALGDVRIDNDLVRGGVRGDLTLTGTLSSMGLLGTLSMTPGSVATFRGHDFQLTHAVVDLTERRRIRAQLDVHGEAQVRDYQVFMHTFGPFEDPQLQLTSQPALTQEDIITLLSVGVTSRDTAVAGSGSGAITAAAGQALLGASGLDEQLKRFLPRDGVFKDVTLRITSAYTEGTGQVVPKAELESKVDLEKLVAAWKKVDLRLRYQAPISGGNQGRGQRAQAELKFTDKLSAQLQLDTDNSDVAVDAGADLRYRLEWND